jgi:type II secretory pathway component PulK
VKINSHSNRRGIALIIVMMIITVFTVLVMGFAKSMRTEVTLARNSNYDQDFDWLGRSGIEYARYILGLQMGIQNEPYDSLGQKWAGGNASTNEIMMDIHLEGNTLGPGQFSLKIVDLERKVNINLADDIFLKQGFVLVGVDPSEIPPIVDAILDWRDPDDDPHLNGAESDYYLTLTPPRQAKNGPIDDLSELLLIKGITPEMYDGGPATHAGTGAKRGRYNFSQGNAGFYTNALKDIFTPLSARVVNLNTASATVLQMFQGIDDSMARAIITFRAGPDGVDGTEDDVPFRNPGELVNVPGFNRTGAGNASRYFSVRSATFEVTVTVEIDNHKRDMIAYLYRTSPKDVRLLFSYWK